MKTNIEMIRELEEVYTPETKRVVNIKEIHLINEKLCLDNMDKLQLFNLRDMVVMWYSSKMDSLGDDFKSRLDVMDKLSAITSVIDLKLQNLEKESYERV